MADRLFWTPIHSAIEELIDNNGESVILIISPFIRLEALRIFINRPNKCTAVIARWRPSDVLSGVSDIEIYPFLKENGIALYLHDNIHLKLYIFESNKAFNTSGNLTMKGFGYCDNANIETGNMVSISDDDWYKIYELIENSYQVDDLVYEKYKKFVSENKEKYKFEPLDFDIKDFKIKQFTLHSFPATETPELFLKYYKNRSLISSNEGYRRYIHDIAIFHVPYDLSYENAIKHLKTELNKNPFMNHFMQYLKAEKSLRFGAVNEWIHNKCEDVPLPYRWELKENTSILYDWLSFFNDEISWDRPNHSQVIYWKTNL